MPFINNASTPIQWQVIRKNSAFLKRQRGIPKLFSTEKFNPVLLNSIRHNGLVNKKAVNIQVRKDTKGVVVTMKKPDCNYKPANSTVTIELKKGQKRIFKPLVNLMNRYQPSARRKVILRTKALLKTHKLKKIEKNLPVNAVPVSSKTEA